MEKVEKRKENLEEHLRAAGGKTSQALGYQIRREEDNKRKALAAIDRIEVENEGLQEDISTIQKKMGENRQLQERHKQRLVVVEVRLAYLATQKAKESYPQPFMERIQAAVPILAECTDERMQPIKELLAQIVAQPAQHHLCSEGSSSPEDDSSNATDELLGRTGEEEWGGMEEYEEERRKEIGEARERFATLQKQYQQDLDSAARQQPSTEPIKRRLGEDKPKEEKDVDMEKEAPTAGLTPGQVVQRYRQRLKQKAEELHALERDGAKELIPVVQNQVGKSFAAGSAEGKEKEGKESKEEPGAGLGAAGKEEAGDKAAKQSESTAIEVDSEGEGKVKKEGQKTRRKVHPSIEVHLQMLAQERMQKQQEVERAIELDRLHKLAVVRRVAVEIQNRCRASPY